MTGRMILVFFAFTLGPLIVGKAVLADTTERSGGTAPSTVPGFTITKCQYHLVDSSAGNHNYYVSVNVGYAAARLVAAARMAFNIDGHIQYTIAQNLSPGNGSHQFLLISPDNNVQSVTCSAVPPTT